MDSEHCVPAGKGASQRQAFFALSAHGFSIDPNGHQDGYTVLFLSDEETSEEQPLKPAKSDDPKGVDQEGKRFVLWEII